MPQRPVKNKSKLVLRPMKSGRIRPYWKVNQTRLVAFPVIRQSVRYRDQLNLKANRFAKSVVRSSSSTRWAIALVKRTGPNDFDILKRSIVTYENPNLGQRILDKLAEEFGSPESSRKLIRIRPTEFEGIS